jgi:hypothetical protein
VTLPPRAPRARRTANRVDDVAATLLRALRHTVERGRASVEECLDVVRVHLARPGGPAHALPREQRAQLFRALDVLAKQMDAPTPRALYAFARSAAEAGCSMERGGRHPGFGLNRKIDDTSALARAAVFAEAPHAKDSEDLVRRAVTRALKEKKRKGAVVKVDVAEGDPLRALLDLPAHGGVFLPRNDVRARLAHLAKHSAMGEALQSAAHFAESLVRPALGEELWDIARPVGKSAKREHRVVVEVGSSTAAQEVHLRKREIVERLRRVRGLETTNDLEIVVLSPRVLPVLGR